MRTFIAVALGILLLISAAAAKADVQISRTNSQAATAYFTSLDSTGCIQTDASIQASQGSDSFESTNVIVSQFDSCEQNLLLSAFGVTLDSNIDIDPGLGEASVQGDVTIDDIISGTPIDADVDLSWTATGRKMTASSTQVEHTSDSTTVVHFVGHEREATAEGTIYGPDGNYAPTPSTTGQISKSKSFEITVTH